jgi:mono/diheme cytochrome c family protein
MRRFVLAVVVLSLPLAYEGARAAQATQTNGPGAAPPIGNAEAGKQHWALGNTSCRNCHGADGEGALAPALAGRKLPFERFKAYVRNPVGRMPAYIPSELTDQEIADMIAWFDGLPPSPKPSAWRTPLPPNAPRGQQLAIATIGCAQCHGATFETPRHGAAEVTGDWEWFKHMVYEHTTAQPEQWAMLDPNLPRTTPTPAGPPGRNRMRMGNYSRARLPESILKEIFDWMMDLNYLPPLAAQLTAGPPAATGASYTVDVTNAGVRGKGVTVEDMTISVALPAGMTVVAATGTGYQGVRADQEAKANAAVWHVPSMKAGDRETFTLTLSSPAETLRGRIHWAKPAVKADGEVDFNFTPAGRGRGRAAL